ncbi:hypothetical protein QUF80_01690 [Desulfococcaceae bacterium HSG8]|nr:hypothetical protein [Desulfococcaceae bacterium HSG8]
MQFVVPPSGGITPPEGGTANLDLVCFLLEITFTLFLTAERLFKSFGTI